VPVSRNSEKHQPPGEWVWRGPGSETPAQAGLRAASWVIAVSVALIASGVRSEGGPSAGTASGAVVVLDADYDVG